MRNTTKIILRKRWKAWNAFDICRNSELGACVPYQCSACGKRHCQRGQGSSMGALGCVSLSLSRAVLGQTLERIEQLGSIWGHLMWWPVSLDPRVLLISLHCEMNLLYGIGLTEHMFSISHLILFPDLNRMLGKSSTFYIFKKNFI